MFSTLTDACGTAEPPGSITIPPKLAVVNCAYSEFTQNTTVPSKLTNVRKRMNYTSFWGQNKSARGQPRQKKAISMPGSEIGTASRPGNHFVFCSKART